MSTIRFSSDPAALARDAAAHLAQRFDEILETHPFCTLAISGGETTIRLFEVFASPEFYRRIPWDKLRIFWVDERFVPTRDADSNYGQVAQVWRGRLPLTAENTFPMPVPPETESLAAAAEEYEALLRKLLAGRTHPLDIVLLGLGPDGHTASLFPGHATLEEKTRWVLPVADSPKPPPQRVTLALPLLNQAGEIIFLIAGAAKAETVERVLKHPEARLPAQKVKPVAGIVFYWLDAAAGARIK